MERVVSTISVRKKRDAVRVIGYSKTDRGQKFVYNMVSIDTHNLSDPEVDAKIKAAVEELLKNQSNGT